jgi:hypothetical protein
MASIQRASRDLPKAVKGNKLHIAFRSDQLIANQMLRTTMTAYRLTEQAVRDRPGNEPMAELFINRELPSNLADRYGIPEMTVVRTLREELGVVDRRLQDAIIIYYIGAFERFLNNFCKEASTILSTRGCDEQGALQGLLNDAKRRRARWSINLRQAAEHLPEIKARLTVTFPTYQPVRNAPSTWDCFTMTQMWIEIRNLIAHHDRHGRFKIVKAGWVASRDGISRCDLVWRVAVEMRRSSGMTRVFLQIRVIPGASPWSSLPLSLPTAGRLRLPCRPQSPTFAVTC